MTQNKCGICGSSRTWVLAGLAAAGVVAVGAILMYAGKPAPVAPETGANAVVPNAAAPGGPAVARNAAAPDATPQPAADWLQDAIRILKDSSQSFNDRQRALKSIIQNGSPQAIKALADALKNGAQDLRRAAAESMRGCTGGDCTELLLALAHDSDEAVAMAAARSLGAKDSPEAATALTALLSDAAQPSTVRCEAALGLGSMDQFGVVATLIQAAKQFDDADVATASLKALGRRDFNETQSFFQDFVQSSDTPAELRAAAIQALGAAEGDPTAFLTKMATDPDPDVRIAAAEALSMTSATGNFGQAVLAMLGNEEDPDVRLRLYQALANQESYDVGTALAMVQAETDPSAKIAGLDLLAKTLQDNPTPALQQYFDQTATAELKNDALNAEAFDDRQMAIVALTRARTPAAKAALQELASQLAQPPPAGATPGQK